LFVAIAMATWPGAALAAPVSGLVVAQSAACRVALVAVSYDDPGADDAEFLELRVDRFAQTEAPGGTNDGCDAGSADSDHDAAPIDAATGPVLGDCGLGALELVDGAAAACETYRAIPLSAVPIPPDGYVVLCPAGSSIDTRAHCDVATAGRSALRAGWLQNGPNDGLRFIDTGGGVALEVGYEGGPSCFEAAAVSLAPESGGTTSDDVNAACGGVFTLLSEEDAPFRDRIRCPGERVGGAMGSGSVPDGGTDAAGDTAADGRRDSGRDASPWMPERAPAPASRGTAPVYGHIDVDAGIALFGRPPPGFPRPPACTVALGRRTPVSVALVFAGCALLARRIRRRREPGLGALRHPAGPCSPRASPQARNRAKRVLGYTSGHALEDRLEHRENVRGHHVVAKNLPWNARGVRHRSRLRRKCGGPAASERTAAYGRPCAVQGRLYDHRRLRAGRVQL
jgi:hypothetical protein